MHQISREGDDAIVEVDESVYEAPAVLRAAYWLTARAYVLIQRPSPGTLRVRVRAKHPKPTLQQPKADDALVLAGELANALVDHQLREEVARRTGRIREMILEKALLENDVSGPLPTTDAWDPVGKEDGDEWPPR